MAGHGLFGKFDPWQPGLGRDSILRFKPEPLPNDQRRPNADVLHF